MEKRKQLIIRNLNDRDISVKIADSISGKRLVNCKLLIEVPEGYTTFWTGWTYIAANPDGPPLILRDEKWEVLKFGERVEIRKEVVDAEAVDRC